MEKVQKLLKKLESFCSETETYSVKTYHDKFMLLWDDDPEFSTTSEEELISKLEKKIEYKERNDEVKDREITITDVTCGGITFSNGYFMFSSHYPDCCEYNYADWEQLDDLARGYTFKGKLRFESVPYAGFRFGDSRRMFFVPCYSEQNGYYSDEVCIYLSYINDTRERWCMLSTECESIYC